MPQEGFKADILKINSCQIPRIYFGYFCANLHLRVKHTRRSQFGPAGADGYLGS